MASEYQQWQEVKANYLKQIEKNLAQIDHPQRSEILANVGEHLDSKYAELLPVQKNWESFQQIITEMGPPEEYVELLCEESSVPMRKRLYVTERLTIILLAGLIGVISYLVFKHFCQVPSSSVGYWKAVDFVTTIDAFVPGQSNTEDLFIKTLDFKEDGTLFWTVGDSQPIKLNWTEGIIRPAGVWPASYSIKRIQGEDYLFYAYQTRDRNPAGYYVFKRTDTPPPTAEQQEMVFVNDPRVLGKWVAVDFVRTLDLFAPDPNTEPGQFHVRSLNFKKQGIVKWGIGESQMTGRWTKGKLLDEELSARYFIETYEDGDYLFMEWNSGDVTIRGQKPAYYVLKKED